MIETREQKIARVMAGGKRPRHAVKPVAKLLPGDALKQLIWERYRIPPCKACHATAAKMNENGVQWCRDNIELLAEELHHNAQQRTWTAMLDACQRVVYGNAKYIELIGDACDRCEPVVVMVLNAGVDSSWLHSRGDVPVDVMKSLGLSAVWVQDQSHVVAMCRHARLIINRAFAMSVDVVESLATAFPDTKFVSCCHSSQSYLMLNSGSSLKHQNEFIDLAQRIPNCYYATVDDRNYPGEIHERCLYLPNVVDVFDMPTRIENECPVISLAGRADMIKNFPQQVIALSMVAADRPIKVQIAIKGNAKPILDMARQWKLDASQQWHNYSNWIASLGGIDIGLQCSFSESFNYVGLEQLLAGVPVVGSSATRYIPDEWRADPEQPESIAWIVNRMLDSPPSRKHCRAIAESTASQCNREFANVIGRLCE